ncbi:hypothetical protein RIF29_10156 [Crotalaria pallida]|uniref:Uncharacterized protein n=1 Tax=Crotalaria pallida TaxID=3830 RepID=A0AAN9II93_CROPI
MVCPSQPLPPTKISIPLIISLSEFSNPSPFARFLSIIILFSITITKILLSLSISQNTLNITDPTLPSLSTIPSLL